MCTINMSLKKTKQTNKRKNPTEFTTRYKPDFSLKIKVWIKFCFKIKKAALVLFGQIKLKSTSNTMMCDTWDTGSLLVIDVVAEA